MSSQPAAEHSLGLPHVGRRVLAYPVLGSTNDRAAELAGDPANAGTVVLADRQEAGRGQYGRTWQAPAGSSVLMSALVFPPEPLARPVIMTALAAVAACEAAERLAGDGLTIKWPNDIHAGGRKLAGILIERRGGVVIGVGMNVNQTGADFAAAGLPEAVSLATLTGCHRPPAEAAEAVIRRLDHWYGELLAGRVELLEGEWRRRLGLIGRAVIASSIDGGRVSGFLQAVGFDGIALEVSGGRPLRLLPERVRNLG